MITFDHLKLVRRDFREVARYRRLLLSLQQGELQAVDVTHDPGGSCCRREPWPLTNARLTEAIEPAVPIVFINMEEAP